MQRVPDHLKTLACFSTSYFLKQTHISFTLFSYDFHKSCDLYSEGTQLQPRPRYWPSWERFQRTCVIFYRQVPEKKSFQPLKRIYGCGLYPFIIHNCTTLIRYYNTSAAEGPA